MVHSFFASHPLETLVTLSPEGRPQSAAVYIFIDAGMYCYCVTRKSTRKYNNVLTHGTALLSAFDENTLMCGELWCDAEVLTVPEEIDRITFELQRVVASRRSSYWVPPVSQLEGTGYEIIKMRPRSVTFVNYEKSSSDNPEPHKVSFEMS